MSATPGPWKHVTIPRPFGGEPWEVVEGSDGNPLGEFYGNDECSAANARLAAAAPDLLAALKEARAELEAYEEISTGEKYNNPELNAAIAKAEGVE